MKIIPMLVNFEKNRYNYLLVATITFLVIPAYITNPFLYNLLLIISMSFLFVQSMIAVFEKRSNRMIAFIAGAIVLTITWLDFFREDNSLQIIQLAVYIVFFSYIMVALIRVMVKGKIGTGNLIVLAIVIYLIIGIVGGGFSMMIHLLIPDSFSIHDKIASKDLLDFTYFSFVTMTTLGYGDVTPVRQESQTLSYMLAVIGQLYIAITIATIVSQHASRTSSKKADQLSEKK